MNTLAAPSLASLEMLARRAQAQRRGWLYYAGWGATLAVLARGLARRREASLRRRYI